LATTETAGRARTIRLPSPRRAVVLGRLGSAGSVGVSAVASAWERLPPAESVTWFPRGTAPMLLASPGPGAPLEPGETLRLRFSEPVATLLGGRTPTVRPRVPGTWRTVDAHTLAFTPRGYGFGLDGHVQVTLPAEHWPPANAMVDLAPAIKQTTEEKAPCV
jgi:hypothetical protein